ncbi:MAG: hypothetical protein LBC95_00355 [Candidatus Nomurabacteria bacterium]|jgi:hypothetical protein|nr:hypothetical protein [Candidatus Nomurabacteria bacterium]
MNTVHYKSLFGRLTGVNENELWHKARLVYGATVKSKRRLPYVRSKYFKNEKVFLDLFWSHTNSKKPRVRRERLAFYQCGLDLIHNTTHKPKEIYVKGNLCYKFLGLSRDNEEFCVQIKREKNGGKWLLSIFPTKI